MSWATDDPEGYDEVLRDGVAEKLVTEAGKHGFNIEDADNVAQIVAFVLQEECPKAFEELVLWAGREVGDAEANHHGL